jgi:cysteine desulfurase
MIPRLAATAVPRTFGAVRIYLDHNATTPPRAEVVEAMLRALREGWGNPSSVHAEGAAARACVERARGELAELLGARPGEVVFTAGATEANNAVLRGVARRGRGRHLVTTSVEHPSVREPAAALAADGFELCTVPVDAEGLVDPDALEAALRPDTALVSVIWANNETGVVQPLEEIAERVKAKGLLLHVDATQALGKYPVDLRRVPVDYLACSAHKMNGPKGVGALVVREGAAFEPWLRGGAQERGRRGGTEDVAGIAGFGAACRLARGELAWRIERWGGLRDRLWDGIQAKVPRVRRNGSPGRVLCNTLNVEFEGADGEALLQALDLEGVAVSSGAACHSGSISPSAVLLALGRTPEQARASLRFSVGHDVNGPQIDRVLALLPDLVARARAAGAP